MQTSVSVEGRLSIPTNSELGRHSGCEDDSKGRLPTRSTNSINFLPIIAANCVIPTVARLIRAFRVYAIAGAELQLERHSIGPRKRKNLTVSTLRIIHMGIVKRKRSMGDLDYKQIATP